MKIGEQATKMAVSKAGVALGAELGLISTALNLKEMIKVYGEGIEDGARMTKLAIETTTKIA